MHADSLSSRKATFASVGDSQTLQGRSGSVSVGSFCPGVPKVLFEHSEHLWQAWGLILNTTSPLLSSGWSFSFGLGCGVSFLGGIPHSSVDGCSATFYSFGVIAGENEHTSFQKNIYFCFIDYTKAFDCVDHTTNCRKFLKLWEYQKTLLASWEICMQVKKQLFELDMEKINWLQIGKRVHQGFIFKLFAEYVMQSARLDEAQTGIKFAGKNINNLRYADDTPLWQKVKRN